MNRMLDVVVNQPAGPIFSPKAQLIVAGCIGFFFVCWGLSKLIRAWKKP